MCKFYKFYICAVVGVIIEWLDNIHGVTMKKICVALLLLLVNRQRMSSNLKWGKLMSMFPVHHTVQRHFLARKLTLCLFLNLYYRKRWMREIRSMAGKWNPKSDGMKDSEVTRLECFNSHPVSKWRKANKVKITREEE